MRFYSLSYLEVIDLPIRTFWALSRMIERVRSDEILAWMPAHSIAMGGDHVKKIIDELKERVGQPSITEQLAPSGNDLEALRKQFG